MLQGNYSHKARPKKFEIPGQPLSGIGAGGRIFFFSLKIWCWIACTSLGPGVIKYRLPAKYRLPPPDMVSLMTFMYSFSMYMRRTRACLAHNVTCGPVAKTVASRTCHSMQVRVSPRSFALFRGPKKADVWDQKNTSNNESVPNNINGWEQESFRKNSCGTLAEVELGWWKRLSADCRKSNVLPAHCMPHPPHVRQQTNQTILRTRRFLSQVRQGLGRIAKHPDCWRSSRTRTWRTWNNNAQGGGCKIPAASETVSLKGRPNYHLETQNDELWVWLTMTRRDAAWGTGSLPSDSRGRCYAGGMKIEYERVWRVDQVNQKKSQGGIFWCARARESRIFFGLA